MRLPEFLSSRLERARARLHLIMQHSHGLGVCDHAGLPDRTSLLIHRLSAPTASECAQALNPVDDSMWEIGTDIVNGSADTALAVEFVDAFTAILPDGFVDVRREWRLMRSTLRRRDKAVPATWVESRDWGREYCRYVRAGRASTAPDMIRLCLPLDLYDDVARTGLSTDAWVALLAAAETSGVAARDLMPFRAWFPHGDETSAWSAEVWSSKWTEVARWHEVFGFERATLLFRAGVGFTEALTCTASDDDLAVLGALRGSAVTA